MSGVSTVQSPDENKFLYNGKEREDELALNWYHYEARLYDSQLGRWMAVDPADEFYRPYVYCHNDPINFLDPDGKYEFDAVGYWKQYCEDYFYNLLGGKQGTIDLSFNVGERNRSTDKWNSSSSFLQFNYSMSYDLEDRCRVYTSPSASLVKMEVAFNIKEDLNWGFGAKLFTAESAFDFNKTLNVGAKASVASFSLFRKNDIGRLTGNLDYISLGYGINTGSIKSVYAGFGWIGLGASFEPNNTEINTDDNN